MTIESICNTALDAIGYKRHIGNIYEGSQAARIALDNWAQIRDSLLYKMEPEWARKDAILMLLKSAPNISGQTANYDTGWTTSFPSLPWLYEYSLPSDNIKPLQIKVAPLFVPVWRPRPSVFRFNIDNDNVEVLLTNAPNAILTYIYRVLNPDFWAEDFQDTMIAALAKMFEPELSSRPLQKDTQDANRAG